MKESTAILASAFFISLSIFSCASQKVEERVDRISVNNTVAHPVINPKSDDESKRTFFIDALRIDGKPSSITGGDRYNIHYRVYDPSGYLCFGGHADADITSTPDLFFTEDGIARMKIPRIGWSGERNIDDDILGKAVGDGIYTIRVNLLSSHLDKGNIEDKILKDDFGNDALPEQIYQVEVRTSKPDFRMNAKKIPDASGEEDAASSEILFYDENHASAARWLVMMSDESGNIVKSIRQGDGVHDIPFSVEQWNVTGLAGRFRIKVSAEDSVGNKGNEEMELELPLIDSAVMRRRNETDDFMKILRAFSKIENTIHIEKNAECVATLEKPLTTNLGIESVNYSNGLKTHSVKNVTKSGERIIWTLGAHELPAGSYQMSVRMPVNGTIADIAVGTVRIRDDSTLSVRDKFDIHCERASNVDVSALFRKEIPIAKFFVTRTADVPCAWKLGIFDSNREEIWRIADGKSDFFPLGSKKTFEWFGEPCDFSEPEPEWLPKPGEMYYLGLCIKSEYSEAEEAEFEPFVVGMVYETLPEGKGKRVKIPDITFPANGSNFFDDGELFELNFPMLKNISDILKENDEGIRKVTIRGYANPTTYPDKAEMEKEERDSLKPLSQRRATAIRNTLVLLGVDGDKLSAEGAGGLQETWIVNPDSDDKHKNRRIEFFVEGD